ncbi:MAG TPA: glycoside hydrolase family 9 protein [Kineosporiaceae bacterium]
MARRPGGPPYRHPTERDGKPYADLALALQMSLYFFDAQKAGPARTMRRQRLDWRGDSPPADGEIPLRAGPLLDGLAVSGTNLPAPFIRRHRQALDPERRGALDLHGGFHDAGDHVKFGLPQAFSASTLAWALYEFPEAFVATGTYEHTMEHLYWFTDYLLRSVFRDDTGEVVALCYMVGRGHLDHPYWGPPECQPGPRPANLAHAGEPAADQAGAMSAALTLMSLLTQRTDAARSRTCLEAARSLYRFGARHPGVGPGDGFYPSSSSEDKMAWAALWLYRATGVERYLADVVARDRRGLHVGYLRHVTTWATAHYRWPYSWDDLWPAVFALLAISARGVASEDDIRGYWKAFRWHLEYWAGGLVPHAGEPADGEFIRVTPGGFSFRSPWGSARYNVGAQWCAVLYHKYAAQDPEGDPEAARRLADWALSQMNYLTGLNPLRRSYIVGLQVAPDDNVVRHPHHRAAHGSLTNTPDEPSEHRHVLWGALVGGPDEVDQHRDCVRCHVQNEAALDYNAVLAAALAGLFTLYGNARPVRPWRCPDLVEHDVLLPLPQGAPGGAAARAARPDVA